MSIYIDVLIGFVLVGGVAGYAAGFFARIIFTSRGNQGPRRESPNRYVSDSHYWVARMFHAILAVIFIYAMYTAWLGSQNNDLIQYFFAGFYFMGGFGLIFKKIWSKYFVYLVAALIVRNWWYPLWEAHEIEWPFHVTIENIIPLLPGLVLIFLCLSGCIVVHREIEHKQ